MDDLALLVLMLFVLGAAIAASICAVLVKREFEEWARTTQKHHGGQHAPR